METRSINRVTRIYRRYVVEMGIAMAAYCGVMVASRHLLRSSMRDASGGVQIVLAALPVIPVLFLLIAIVRVVRGTDELQRQIYVESLAIAGGMTAMLAVTYGLIESERFPHLSAWWTYSTFMITWLIASFFVRRRYK
jgi:hypothetical protein